MGQCCISTVCITKFLEMFSFVSINILKKPYRGIFRVFLPYKLRMVKKRNYKEVSPEVENSIVVEHLCGRRGCCKKALANKYNLSKSTVRNILNRLTRTTVLRVPIITHTSRPDSMTHSRSQFSIGRPWFSVKSVEQLVLASSGQFPFVVATWSNRVTSVLMSTGQDTLNCRKGKLVLFGQCPHATAAHSREVFGYDAALDAGTHFLVISLRNHSQFTW
jgi:hypothetical protein